MSNSQSPSEHKPQNQTQPHGTVDVGGDSDDSFCAVCGGVIHYKGEWIGIKGQYVRAKEEKTVMVGTIGALICAPCWEKIVKNMKTHDRVEVLTGRAS